VVSYYTNSNKLNRLTVGKLSKSGKNIYGRTVLNHRGSGLKKSLVLVDFFRR
jgi:ribosomal protein L2